MVTVSECYSQVWRLETFVEFGGSSYRRDLPCQCRSAGKDKATSGSMKPPSATPSNLRLGPRVWEPL